MRLLSLAILTLALLLSSISAVPATAQPHGPVVYSRQRTAIPRGGAWPGRDVRYGGYYGGFFPYQQPAIAGSWYARPYPHHFDYYRQRYSGPQQPSVECPCAEVATPE